MVPISICLPEYFLEEEEREGFVVSQQMKEVWAIGLDILSQIMHICEKHNIQYFMAYGTLLGAARHKGFIPWDDDLDIMMMRDQYIKFCQVAKDELAYPYFFQTVYTDATAMLTHAKVLREDTTCIMRSNIKYNYKYKQGIGVDIFPIDVAPDDEGLQKVQHENERQYMEEARRRIDTTERYVSWGGHGWWRIKKMILHHVLRGPLKKLYDHKKMYQKFEAECMKYNHERTKWLVVLGSFQKHELISWRMSREDLDDVVYLPFEMLSVPCPAGYERVLSDIYGDWHKAVQMYDDRVLFDTSVSYTEYINK